MTAPDAPGPSHFYEPRSAFHEEPGEVGATLAGLAELAVPGTAVEYELDGVDT